MKHCEHCITQGICYEEGTCAKDAVDQALGYSEDMLRAPEAELTEKAKVDHVLSLEGFGKEWI